MITSCLHRKSLLKKLIKISIPSKKEICGFILGGDFLQKENIHPDPERFFLVNPCDCVWDEGVVLFHSHPDNIKLKGFSDWDLENQKYFELDMLLYSVNNNKFYFKKYDISSF